jgi:hypothetical protein
MQWKPYTWAYTSLNTYDDVCGYQFFRTYIKKDIPYVATKEMDWGKQVHTAMELRVGGGKPLPAAMRQWEPFAAPFDGLGARTELKLAITRDGRPTGSRDQDVHGRGTVDVAVINATKAVIVDWKTGNSKYEKPFELEIHALLIKVANPQVQQIVGNYVWLKENRAGQVYDLSDFNSTWARVSNIVQEIEDDMASNEFKKRRNPLCAWCRVFDCENNSNPNRG